MTAHSSEFDPTGPTVQDFDCGDGVPALTLADQFGHLGISEGQLAAPTTGPEPLVSIRVFALTAGVLAQVLVGIVVGLGGNPIVGVIAAITILTCSLALIGAEALKPS